MKPSVSNKHVSVQMPFAPHGHSKSGQNPNGQRGWNLNPLNPERLKVLERRAREATAAFEHAVMVCEKHKKRQLRTAGEIDAGKSRKYNSCHKDAIAHMRRMPIRRPQRHLCQRVPCK